MEPGKLLFPPVPDRPGIYRPELRRADGSALYVGETDNLRRRMGNYLCPGPTQQTSQRVHRLLQTCLAHVGKVRLVTLRQAALKIDDRPVTVDLATRASRLLVENAILVALRNAGATVHNL